MSQWQIVSSKHVMRTPIFDVMEDRAVGPGGLKLQRRIVRHPGAVAVLARNGRGEVLLVRQFRLAVRQRLWELPAGKLEPGERPLRAAKRELAEETGCPGKILAEAARALSKPWVLRREAGGLFCRRHYQRGACSRAVRADREKVVFVGRDDGDGRPSRHSGWGNTSGAAVL